MSRWSGGGILAGFAQDTAFQLVEIDEFRRLDSSLREDFDQLLRLEEVSGGSQRSPLREVNDPVGIGVVFQHLIGDFSSLAANAGGGVEDGFPGAIAGDLRG